MRLGKTAKRHQGGFEHDSADDDRLDGPVSRRVGRDCAQLTLGETIGEMGVRCENIGITAPAQLAQRNQCSGERVTRGGLYCWHVPTKPHQVLVDLGPRGTDVGRPRGARRVDRERGVRGPEHLMQIELGIFDRRQDGSHGA